NERHVPLRSLHSPRRQRHRHQRPQRRHGRAQGHGSKMMIRQKQIVSKSLKSAIGMLAILLLSIAAKAQQSVPHPDLVVAKPVVNMLRHRDGTSDVVSQVIYGTGVALLEKSSTWQKIRTADEYTGWVSASDLAPLTAGPYAPEGHAIRVAALSANVYRDPD